MRVSPVIIPCKIFLLGEAPGEEEDRKGLPFVGASGQELNRMLKAGGINRHECSLSNLILERPTGNNFKLFCCDRVSLPHDYPYPAIERGLYLKPDLLSNLERIKEEITSSGANILVALGAKALWAAGKRTDISSVRGTVFQSVFGIKSIATFHPAYVLRDWSSRTIVISDFIKVKREAAFRDIRFPQRKVHLPESPRDLWEFYETHLKNAEIISFDIETDPKRGIIKCIGFAGDISNALVVPFENPANPFRHYWSGDNDEFEAWKFIRFVLEGPTPKLGQNGLYDIQYLLDHHIRVRNYLHDTMLLSHAINPEFRKSLGFLGSMHTDERAWKLLGKSTKRED